MNTTMEETQKLDIELEKLQKTATKQNYSPKDGHLFNPVLSDNDNWQVWAYEASGSPLELIGEDKDPIKAVRQATDWLSSLETV